MRIPLLRYPEPAQSREKPTQLLHSPCTTAAGGITVDDIAALLEIGMTGVIAIGIGGAIDTRGTTVIATIAGIGGTGGINMTATDARGRYKKRDS